MNDNPAIPAALMMEREAALYLRLSRSYLRKVRVGEIKPDRPMPFIRIGRSVRYSKADLDRWIDESPRYRTNVQLMPLVDDTDAPQNGAAD